MKTRLFALIFLHVSVLIYVACTPCTCPPSGDMPFLKVDGITIKSVLGDQNVFNSSFNPPSVNTFSGVDLDKFAIHVKSDVSFIAYQNTCRPNPFISSAMACDCPLIDGSRGLKFDLEKITITPSVDYDSNHLAGKDMSDLFVLSRNDIGFFGSFSSNNEVTISEYIVAMLKAQATYKKEGFKFFIKQSKEFKDDLEKTGKKSMQFDIEFQFSDKSIVKASTNMVDFFK
jgi:hypothetical protein